MECPICLHEIEDQKCETPCGHFYHSSCIFKCLQVSNLCPVCRHVMVKPLVASSPANPIIGVSILRIFDPTMATRVGTE